MDIEKLAEGLVTEGQVLCSRLERVRSLGCVEASFARYLASGAIREARAMQRPPARVKEAGRAGLRQLYERARSWHHSLTKPYGYPGDFTVLELIYEGRAHPETEQAAAALVDIWGTGTSLPRAVRARKDVLRVWLEDQAERAGAKRRLRVLSVACGGARELRDMSPRHFSRFDTVLLDADPRALAFSERYWRSRASAPSLTTLTADAVTGRGEFDRLEQLGPFDIIYSFGLFDYLPRRVLERSVRGVLPHLADNGQFVFSLKDHRHYDHWFYDWFYDWRFVSRTDEDGWRLADRLGLTVEETMLVDGRAVTVFVCRKRPG